MNITRGDVVILDAPFVTRPGSKLRPMLIVQNDRNSARMANTILTTITTNIGRSAESTQVLINPRTSEGKSSGLLSPSVVSCENLITVRRDHIIRTIGRLTDSQMQLVDQALKASLGLS
jgi:mRNA interferase MazF